MGDETSEPTGDLTDSFLRSEIIRSAESSRMRALKKFGLAAVGALPWVGGFIAASLELAENPGAIDDLQREWLEHHARKIEQLKNVFAEFEARLRNFGEEVDRRIESPEYLALVDKSFRQWDEAASEEKRGFVRRLLANAAATALCSDDLVRLFLDWIRKYYDTHFRVIESIYRNKGISRKGIWLKMHDSIPRDDSSEADLFKLLIHDLSVGHVIRQVRETNSDGQFLRKQTRGRSRGPASSTLNTPFDPITPYELTDLGTQFVHYVMNDVAPQLGGPGAE